MNENNIHIGKSAYESPHVERVQVKTEACFAASQSVKDLSDVKVDDWTKTTGAYQSSSTGMDSWTKE